MSQLKIFCCVCAFIVLAVHTSNAETLKVGIYPVQYTVPAGYIVLNVGDDTRNEAEKNYLSFFVNLYKGNLSSLLSLFIPQKEYAALSGNRPLGEYALVYYMDPLADIFFSEDDFSLLKLKVTENGITEETMEAANVPMTVGTQKILKDEPNIFSVAQSVNVGDGQREKVFSVANFLNIDGIILCISYGGQFQTQSDIDALVKKNEQFIQNLNLKSVEGNRPLPQNSSSATSALTQIAPLVLTIVGGITLFMAVVLGLFFFFQKRNQKKG